MRLLIIGNLDGQLGAASKIARSHGAKISQLGTITEALDALRGGQGTDLIMIDVKEDIKRLITSLDEERIHVPVVGCGVSATSEDAVRAIKAGAKEYIPLPPEEALIAAVLEAIVEEQKSLIFSSDAMQEVINMAEQIAPSEASVLITGESGTGKEVIARYLHDHSKRTDKPMISINCAAIPENLLESELFGHEKGAFSGAVARRIGKFEEADGGTLLLDEISEMDIRLQAKLLRAIQEKEIDRVGGSSPVKVNIRILATSNRNMLEEVEAKRFREDLYFRLNVITLSLPPMRKRKEDIEPLAEHFIAKYSEANGVALRALSDEALTKLLNYDWPGNVRELENTLHRAVLLASGGDISPDAIMLSGDIHKKTQAADSDDTGDSAPSNIGVVTDSSSIGGLVGRKVEEVERDLIIGTLDHCLGNRTHAANILGISIRTLRNKLRTYADSGVDVPGAREG